MSCSLAITSAVRCSIRTAIHPQIWRVVLPKAGSRDALTVTFDREMDDALLRDQLEVEDARGRLQAGQTTTSSSGRVWSWRPKHGWRTGDYRVVVGSSLEDVSGNRVGERSTTKLVHQTRPARVWPSLSRSSVIGSDFMTEIPIRISPEARLLPANTLRFYIHFPRPGEAHFDRDQLWLLNEKEQVVSDPFLVLSQELWSPDGRRLTVLMEPGRIKRGLGADPTHEPALVVGRTYKLVITALGQTARHTFRVSDPVLEAVDETHWRLVSPTVGSLDPVVVHFDRVWMPPFARTRSEF